MNALALLADSLRALLQPRQRVVLLDFPNYANVGDSAIWLGELYLLKRLGVTVSAVGDVDTDSIERLRSIIGTQTILLQGGGNFGDLWPRHQLFREQVVQAFPANRIIQLPQSIHFQQDSRMSESASLFRTHADVHLLVRDRASLTIGQSFAPDRTSLVPDAACCLPVARRASGRHPAWDLLLLMRTDKERAHGGGEVPGQLPAAIRARQADWVKEDRGLSDWLYDKCAGARRRDLGFGESFLNRGMAATAARLARRRFDRGLDLIGDARVVVTDRLHGVIMSWLCGVPVYFVDNCYGKLSAFVDCWLADSPDVVRAGSVEEATRLAADRLASGASRSGQRDDA
jgi:pyruvyl transferase EpsO